MRETKGQGWGGALGAGEAVEGVLDRALVVDEVHVGARTLARQVDRDGAAGEGAGHFSVDE